ncbi:MAG: DUF547 domain-containing protein [Gammaproteobacteria bacterium]|nr:DUF547 domain-containing protein [Gammaproteobacteria bacterium]
MTILSGMRLLRLSSCRIPLTDFTDKLCMNKPKQKPFSAKMKQATLFFAAILVAIVNLPAFSSNPDDGLQGTLFDYSLWTKTLSLFVDQNGRIDYQGLLLDRNDFDQYINALETIGPVTRPDLFPTKNSQLAYYINAYNALVFNGVLSRGPETSSVWSGLISGLNFFVRMDVKIDGRITNLKKLEDRIIRKKFKDPRIHAALNCASNSCPRLPQAAFLPEKLDQQLNQAMTEFVASDANVLVDEKNHRVFISKIFDWFEEDFIDFEKDNGNQTPSLIDYINRFLPANSQIESHFKIDFLKYDKGINSQRNNQEPADS